MMKKYLVIALVLMLTLAGCGNQDSAGTTAPVTEPTVPPGTYVENSPIERETNGAVRVFALEGGRYDTLSAIGDQLLLVQNGEKTTLRLLTGERREVTAEATLEIDLSTTVYRTIYSGLVYYDRQSNEAVYLNIQLQETNRVQLPEDVQGDPAFSPNGNEIFFCVGKEIRALDVELGISRLIKSHTCKSQSLLGSYFDGKMLACSVENEAGNVSTLYISAETGLTLCADNNILQLSSYEDAYFADRMDGSVEQRLFGLFGEQTVQQLNVWDGQAVSALELDGIVCYEQDVQNGLQMDFYELISGKKTASVEMRTLQMPVAFLADRWSGSLWILTEIQGVQELLCWNVKKSSVQDEQIYTSSAYTSASPDADGLALCEDRADDMEDKHGVEIWLWDDVPENPDGYNVEREYQTRAINDCLDQLDAVMSELPEYFLYKSTNTRIRICIVRSVDGTTDAGQYWYNHDAYMLLPASGDIRHAFLSNLAKIVDSRVLGNSPSYDYWNDLNPEGFIYGDASTYSQSYLEGETKAFLNEKSMTIVVEDRYAVFYEAMKPDNAAAFQSETMQQKLLLLCQAIRDAWRWEKKSEVYPWEQYLTESIAYQK